MGAPRIPASSGSCRHNLQPLSDILESPFRPSSMSPQRSRAPPQSPREASSMSWPHCRTVSTTHSSAWSASTRMLTRYQADHELRGREMRRWSGRQYLTQLGHGALFWVTPTGRLKELWKYSPCPCGETVRRHSQRKNRSGHACPEAAMGILCDGSLFDALLPFVALVLVFAIGRGSASPSGAR
jgi:hypothetical protein